MSMYCIARMEWDIRKFEAVLVSFYNVVKYSVAISETKIKNRKVMEKAYRDKGS